MPLPMQVSLPLALHLRSPVTYNIFSNQHWKTGDQPNTHRTYRSYSSSWLVVAYRPRQKFDNGHSLADFAFLDQRSGRSKATFVFAAILRAIFNHPDWAQLHAFFSTRYTENQKEIDSAIHTLHPFDNEYGHHKPSVGALRSGMLGPDPQPAVIGPAISAACGASAYMDLVYAGHPPGEYPELSSIAGRPYGWHKDEFQAVTQDIVDPTSKKGGRGRYLAEWSTSTTALGCSSDSFTHTVSSTDLARRSSARSTASGGFRGDPSRLMLLAPPMQFGRLFSACSKSLGLPGD
ncbi:hypothetical protein BDW75DRAFT_243009 [Aspergillus navahoensis]